MQTDPNCFAWIKLWSRYFIHTYKHSKQSNRVLGRFKDCRVIIQVIKTFCRLVYTLSGQKYLHTLSL